MSFNWEEFLESLQPTDRETLLSRMESWPEDAVEQFKRDGYIKVDCGFPIAKSDTPVETLGNLEPITYSTHPFDVEVFAAGARGVINGIQNHYLIRGVDLSNVQVPAFPDITVSIPFHHGPVTEGLNGVTLEMLLGICLHRLQTQQGGPYPCAENDEAINHIDKAIAALDGRTARVREEAKSRCLPTDYQETNLMINNADQHKLGLDLVGPAEGDAAIDFGAPQRTLDAARMPNTNRAIRNLIAGIDMEKIKDLLESSQDQMEANAFKNLCRYSMQLSARTGDQQLMHLIKQVEKGSEGESVLGIYLSNSKVSLPAILSAGMSPKEYALRGNNSDGIEISYFYDPQNKSEPMRILVTPKPNDAKNDFLYPGTELIASAVVSDQPPSDG